MYITRQGNSSMAKKQWVFCPNNIPKLKISQQDKDRVKVFCDTFIDDVLKKHIKPPPKNSMRNYCIDVFSKWRGNSLSIMTTYRCPDPQAISPTFRYGLAKLTYDGYDTFTLSYMRHTGKWQRLFGRLSIDKAIDTIKEMPFFELY